MNKLFSKLSSSTPKPISEDPLPNQSQSQPNSFTTTMPPPSPYAARTITFKDAVLNRKSIYALSNKLPSGMTEERVRALVYFSIRNCPSAFNVQSARAVVLFREQHEKMWDMGDEIVKTSVPPHLYESMMKARIAGFRAAYGSVLWFEDEAAIATLAGKNPMIKDVIPEWSDHSSGMHQFVLWCSLEAEGLGCNLQHYNYSPEFSKRVRETWGLPETWKLKSQLVFGEPTNGGQRSRERTFEDVHERVKLFG